MPSASLRQWQNDRMPRLHQVDLQCAASLAAPASNPHLIDENLRGYVLLLSAHFQGFCRDLCIEAAQVIASKVRRGLQALIQDQFSAHRSLDRGNPNVENLRKDFLRFGFSLDLAADPAALTNEMAMVVSSRGVGRSRVRLIRDGFQRKKGRAACNRTRPFKW